MLKGEVNTLDQILVEEMRILFPELYGFVRDNSPTFVVEDTPYGPVRYPASGLTRKAPAREGLGNIAQRVMPNAGIAEQAAGANLLEHLFGNPPKRGSISNARYFDRYFSYTMSPEDITDGELEEFLRLCKEDDDERSGPVLKALTLRNTNVLIGRLRAFAGQLNRDMTERVARVLARHGAFFEAVGGPRHTGARAEAATLIVELILNSSGTTEQRGAPALLIVNEADSLAFGFLIFRGLLGVDFANSDPVLPEAADRDLRAALVDRISVSAQTRPPYEEFEAADALSLLVLWHHERPAELRAYVTTRIKHNVSEAAEILNIVGNVGWGNFQFLVAMVDIELFNAALEIHFASVLAKGEWTSELSVLNEFRSYLRVRANAGQSVKNALEKSN